MALSDDPGLRAALAESRQSAAAATRELRSLAARLSAQRDAFKRDAAARRAEFETQARRGEFGPDQQRIQRRVDAGETTWEDVAAGRDEDPSAAAARAHMNATFSALHDELQRDEEFQRADAEAKDVQERIERSE
jgi:hypothetical protein